MFGHGAGVRERQTPLALIVVSLLFLAPIGLLIWLFLQESRKDIVFVDKEIAGVAYGRAVWPILSDTLAANGAPTGMTMRRWDAVREAGEVNDPEMDTLEARKRLGQALSRIDDPKQAAAEILDAAAALITKIDDGSNLTLDPDLESFYLIESATVKLPALAIQSRELLGVSPPGKGADSVEARVAAERAVERFRAALEAFDNSVNAVGRTFGAPHPALAAARNRIDSVSADLMQRMRADTPGAPSADGAAALAKELALVETGYWDAATAELERILTARASRLTSAQWFNLLAVAAICAGVFLVVGYMAFSANRGIDRIAKRLRRP